MNDYSLSIYWLGPGDPADADFTARDDNEAFAKAGQIMRDQPTRVFDGVLYRVDGRTSVPLGKVRP